MKNFIEIILDIELSFSLLDVYLYIKLKYLSLHKEYW